MRQARIPPAVFTLSVLVALLLASPPAALRAQEFRALITGQVMDPSGAAIPGAAIKAVKPVLGGLHHEYSLERVAA